MSNFNFKPGLYGHYKGGLYIALMICETHNHNGDLDVIYYSCSTGKGVTRPLQQDSRKEDSWNDPIVWPDGVTRPRFVFLEPKTG